MSDIHWMYVFNLKTPEEKRYHLYFDSQTMELKTKNEEEQEAQVLSEAWARLSNCQCAHCPLSEAKVSYCPVAQHLGQVARHFAAEKSYVETQVLVVKPERSYLKKTTLQEGLHSLFGLIMATSGCPHMSFLRPLARFHLPFASAEESMVRNLSFFVLSEFFRNPNSACDLKILEDRYNKVRGVNRSMVERIRTISAGDAGKNAITLLDGFAMLLSMDAMEDFTELRKFFDVGIC